MNNHQVACRLNQDEDEYHFDEEIDCRRRVLVDKHVWHFEQEKVRERRTRKDIRTDDRHRNDDKQYPDRIETRDSSRKDEGLLREKIDQFQLT